MSRARVKMSSASKTKIKTSMKSLRASSKKIHVIPQSSGWAVKSEGASKASKVYDRRADAISKAKKAVSFGRDVIIHDKNGRVAKWVKSSSKKK